MTKPDGIEAIAPRFWAKVQRGGPDECWLWTASKNSCGYGSISFRGRGQRVHRVSLWLHGRDIPEGLVVDHVCRTRLCVNPNHLRVVTNHVNVRENSVAFAAINGDKTHCLNGHPLDGYNLIVRDGKRRCRACDNVRNQEYYTRKHADILDRRQRRRDRLKEARSRRGESPTDAQGTSPD